MGFQSEPVVLRTSQPYVKITRINQSGINFVATSPTSLRVMDDLTDIWLTDAVNLDAVSLDVFLDNLENHGRR